MMSNALTLFLGVAGGVLLYYGADFLVSGGVGIARKLRIPNLIIGLTMVAFGTSAPELTVSINAALRGKGDISVGNVIGSNICNIALILGLCAVVKALPVNRQVVKGDLPVMTLATLALAGLLYFTGGVPRWGGLIFILMMACYLAWLFISAKQSKEMQNH
jgi:cation:H+ antiporter